MPDHRPLRVRVSATIATDGFAEAAFQLLPTIKGKERPTGAICAGRLSAIGQSLLTG